MDGFNPGYFGDDPFAAMRNRLGIRDSLGGWNSIINEFGGATPPDVASALAQLATPAFNKYTSDFTYTAPNVTTTYNENISQDGGTAYENNSGGSGNRGRNAGNGGGGMGGRWDAPPSPPPPSTGFYNDNGRYRDRTGGRDGIIGNGGGGNRDARPGRDSRNGGGGGNPFLNGNGRLADMIRRVRERQAGMPGKGGGPGDNTNYRRQARQLGIDTSQWNNTPQSDRRDYRQQLRNLPSGVVGPNGRVTYPYMPQPTQYYQQTGTTPPWRATPYRNTPGAGQPGTSGPSTQSGSSTSGNPNGATTPTNPNPNPTSTSLYPRAPQGYTPPPPPVPGAMPGQRPNSMQYQQRAQRFGADTSNWANNGQNAQADFRDARQAYRQRIANNRGM